MPAEQKERYRPKDTTQRLGYLVEEAGEVLQELGNLLAAAGKSQRWGLDSTNPELPIERRKTNRRWLNEAIARVSEEMIDLSRAIALLREAGDL